MVTGLIYFEYVALFLVKIGPLTNSDLLRFRYPTNDCSNYFRCLLVSDYRKISRETFPDYGTAQRHNTNIVMTMEQEQIETVFTNALSNQVQMHVQTFTLVGHVAKVYIFGSPFTAVH